MIGSRPCRTLPARTAACKQDMHAALLLPHFAMTPDVFSLILACPASAWRFGRNRHGGSCIRFACRWGRSRGARIALPPMRSRNRWQLRQVCLQVREGSGARRLRLGTVMWNLAEDVWRLELSFPFGFRSKAECPRRMLPIRLPEHPAGARGSSAVRPWLRREPADPPALTKSRRRDAHETRG